MRPEFRSESRSWGESLQFAYDLPDLPKERRIAAPRRIVWFALGLAVGLVPVMLG